MNDNLVFGRHAVKSVLDAKPDVVRVIYLRQVDLDNAEAMLLGADSNDGSWLRQKIKVVDAARLDQLSGGRNHQGVIAKIDAFQMTPLATLLAVDKPLIVACDQIQDPHNLGTVFRSAAVFGATGLMMSKDKSATITPTVHKVSSGATWRVPATTVVNMRRALSQAKAAGLWIVGSVESGGCPPSQAPLVEPSLLIVGNEERGMRRLLQQHCDCLVTIPVANPAFPALNVASATAVLLYEAACQRSRSGTSPKKFG